jgi:hypothetical protein
MSLDALTTHIKRPPNPIETGTTSDWNRVEAELAFVFPEEYKQFIQVYGSGCIDGFLWVMNPFSANSNMELAVQARLRQDALRSLIEDFNISCPYAWHDLVPWAFTDNGDVLYFLRANTDEDSSIVISDAGATEFQEVSMSLSLFLIALVTRTLRVSVFPDDFPSDAPLFQCLQQSGP